MNIKHILLAAFVILAPVEALAMTDSEALNLIATIDRNEIQASDLASQKTIDSKVADYAKMLNQEHSKNLEETEKLAVKEGVALPETPAVKDLTDQGAKDLKELQLLNGKQFDTAYITAMIKGHTDALDMIDNQLKNSVQSDDVKKHITKTREHVDKHLQEAQKIQKEIM